MIKPHQRWYCRPVRKNLLRAQTWIWLSLGVLKCLPLGLLAPIQEEGKELGSYGSSGRDITWTWQEDGSSWGGPRHKLWFLLIYLPNPQWTTGRMSLPFAISQTFPPVLPFRNGNQRISLLRFLFFVPLIFPLLSLYLCASRSLAGDEVIPKELSWAPLIWANFLGQQPPVHLEFGLD